MSNLELAQGLLNRLKEIQIKQKNYKKIEAAAAKRVKDGEINYIWSDESYRNADGYSVAEYKNTAVLLRKVILESIKEVN